MPRSGGVTESENFPGSRPSKIRKLSNTKTTILIATGVLILNFTFSKAFRYFFFEGGTTASLVRKLASNDRDTVLEGYDFLTERADPVAVDTAIAHLVHPDPYVWFNAAIYLGACNEKAAIPYLIKGLRHPAKRSYGQVATYLISLTGNDFGTDFDHWKKWWEDNGGAPMDWPAPLSSPDVRIFPHLHPSKEEG